MKLKKGKVEVELQDKKDRNEVVKERMFTTQNNDNLKLKHV